MMSTPPYYEGLFIHRTLDKCQALIQAEELIKKEMLHMLHFDLANFPTSQAGSTAKHKAAIEKAKQVLEEKPYEVISLEDMQMAHQLLEAEMEVVKHGMNHGEISLDTYSTVWQECYKQLLFIPGVNKYTRASMASNKD
ncbi:cell division cycle 5-like protein isoform X1 [Dysidea avara]|uniref:cell division cycle 5-like protein isoform X1 n=1 Tax=Dysidea avara TaxID=196820 RepID=UPI003322B038